ncbi:hypothetical protein ACH5RR_009067 [Cinchona calisaya]|uniref:PB1 domain-containing protein n=1 Tax=Cinchona calisaya TaxID=153742 RepID=A0ABD3AD36_9GENT
MTSEMHKNQSSPNYYSISEFIMSMPGQLSWSDNKSFFHLKLFWSPDFDHHIQFNNNKGKIKSALEGLDVFSFPTLVQPWMPKAISCNFRPSIRLDCGEERDLGPVGRVFRNGLPEFSPYVSCYSVQEFKLRDDVVSCGVCGYLALPVFELVGNQCVCVLELITIWDGDHGLTDAIGKVSEVLQAVGLRLSNMCSLINRQPNSQHEFALCEIEKGLKAVCDTHSIPFAQTWFTTTADNNIQTTMYTREKGSYMLSKKLLTFQKDCIQFCLKKGQGVVWRAFTSSASCFCKDVKQLNIDQYPLVLSARKVDLTGSFAICLQNKCTGNDVYVLEFFLPSNQARFRKPQTFLNSLLATVKQHFQSFKVACGEEPGTGLPWNVIKLDEDDTLDSSTICATNQSPPVLRLAQNQFVTLHDGRNYSTTKHDDLVAVPNKEGVLKTSEFKVLGNQSGQKLEDTELISHVTRPEQKHLYGKDVTNQPSNKRKADHSLSEQDIRGSENHIAKSCQINQASFVLSLQEEITTPVADPVPQTKENESKIMIKASYKGDMIKFELSLLARIIDFQNEVTKRLKLKPGSYEIKYQSDDNNCISLASDEELQNIMCNVISQKRNTVKLVLDPVRNESMPVQNGSLTNIKATCAGEENESLMTIKATYKGDMIKFQISPSSGMKELKNEVTRRLKLSVESYEVKYQDVDNNWNFLSTDGDLQQYLSAMRLSEKLTVKLHLEPTKN